MKSIERLKRPAEVDSLLANCTKAKKLLKWEPKVSFDDLVIWSKIWLNQILNLINKNVILFFKKSPELLVACSTNLFL